MEDTKNYTMMTAINALIELANEEIENSTDEEKKDIEGVVETINGMVAKINSTRDIDPEDDASKSTQDEMCMSPVAPGLFVRLDIGRVGQEHPSKGNEVIVEATFSIPADEKEPTYINREFEFGIAHTILGYPLGLHWGDKTPSGLYKKRSIKFQAPTWKEAFDAAENYLEAETDKLRGLFKARYEALVAAEGDDE